MKLRRNVLIMLSCLALYVSGCSLMPAEEEMIRPPLYEPIQENRNTVEAKMGDIVKRVKGVAILESANIINYRLINSGTISQVFVEAGDEVKKGDPLLELDDGGATLQVKYKQVAVEKAKRALLEASRLEDASQKTIAELELEIAQIELANANANLIERHLYAQMDGQVIYMDDLQVGNKVDANHVIISIADPSQLRITYQKDGVNMMDVRVGMNVIFEYNGTEFTGKVVQAPVSAPKTDNAQINAINAKTIYMEADHIPQSAQMGDQIEMDIITALRENVVVIPRSGVRSYQGRSFVHVLEGKSVREFDVETGLESNTHVEIIAGLEAGQLVIMQ